MEEGYRLAVNLYLAGEVEPPSSSTLGVPEYLSPRDHRRFKWRAGGKYISNQELP
jgi:hypothetical protein